MKESIDPTSLRQGRSVSVHGLLVAVRMQLQPLVNMDGWRDGYMEGRTYLCVWSGLRLSG